MTPAHDLIIIGAGISGLIHLRYADLAGLDAVVLEREDAIGGLWRDLPAWQDIQIRLADWTTGDLPLEGPRQPHILANIRDWADRFDLHPRIRLSCPVLQARHHEGLWEVTTPQGVLHSRHLVGASGVHNRPRMPDVERKGSGLAELHSSQLRDPQSLAGRIAVVVGGGASAFDLLDLCLEHGASKVHWVYRGLKWFTPTTKPKMVAGSFRPYGKMQASGLTTDQQNHLIGADLLARYAKFGLDAIRPAEPLDLRHDQLIPGRAKMLSRFADIHRHPGSVARLEGHSVVLTDGQRIEADMLLWATGYETDLSYFANPAIAGLRNVPELAARCGCIFRSLDEPNLYFTGVGLEGIGATSLLFALSARTLMSHVLGRAHLDLNPMPHKLNHLDMIRHLAERDPASFGADGGWEHYRDLTLTLGDDQPFPMPTWSLPCTDGGGAVAY
jgi:glycine/D-amino acid oxidase-like deaminating enzyme